MDQRYLSTIAGSVCFGFQAWARLARPSPAHDHFEDAPMAPMAPHTVALHGHDLSLVDRGEGPVVLFIHGILGSQQQGAHLVDMLDRAALSRVRSAECPRTYMVVMPMVVNTVMAT